MCKTLVDFVIAKILELSDEDQLTLINEIKASMSEDDLIAYEKWEACFKQHSNAMLKEYYKDNNQRSFDEFPKRSKEYINQCLAGKEPILEGWFKLVEEQSKDKSIKL